ncbi:nucleotidyltransferase family protein [Lutimonas sp.]|uniref:nucleotidyltransferase family protein n=1 Tax=Lutimonas sp. TaxID=1872403 RepID=UPI003D9AF97C
MSGGHFPTKVGAVVLAAGSSSRMQGIKQLLPWKDSTMVSHVLDQLKESDACHVFLVLGAYHSEILSKIDTRNITVVLNQNWTLGMGSSIARIATYIQKEGIEIDALLLATSDQPILELNTYNKLINSSINSNRIVATSYGKSYGIPAVFGRDYFEELSCLNKDTGAKAVIKKHLKHLILLDDPKAEIDLDTIELYQKFYAIYGS